MSQIVLSLFHVDSMSKSAKLWLFSYTSFEAIVDFWYSRNSAVCDIRFWNLISVSFELPRGEGVLPYAGADPGFFLGGGALVSCSTSTPINHIVFFSQNTSCIRKPQVISGEGAHRLHPPPRFAPVWWVLGLILWKIMSLSPEPPSASVKKRVRNWKFLGLYVTRQFIRRQTP